MTTVEQFQAAAERDPPLRAPYNFVPLNATILPSPWYDRNPDVPDHSPGDPDHGKPHAEGLCGELVVEWQVETPLLVGGRDNNNPFQLGEGGPYAIPGASLRGMIRAVLEILSYPRLEPYAEDQRFALRDYDAVTWQETQKATAQNWRGRLGPPLPGWLSKNTKDDTYHLTECNQIDVPISALAATLGISEVCWHCMSLHDRHDLLATRGLSGEIDLGRIDLELDGRHGTLVVAGLIKTEVERRANPGIKATNKKKEAAFLAGVTGTWPISQEAFEAFAAVQPSDGTGHSDSPDENWSYWKQKLDAGLPVPVFYRGDPKAAESGIPAPSAFHMALTRLMRVPFAFTPKDVVGRSQKPDQVADRLDFVQALFGHVPPQGAGDDGTASHAEGRQRAWRGRVRFGLANLIGEAIALPARSAVTMKPRASFYPFYLRPKPLQPGAEETVKHPVDWSSGDAILAGRKRYPPRNEAQETMPRSPNENQEQENRLVFLEASPAQPLRFRSSIRFHNVLPEELGGLVWAIQLCRPGGGDNRPLRHMLGRAKGFGYGQVKAVIAEGAQSGWIEANGNGSPPSLADCTKRFEKWVRKGLSSEEAFTDLPEVAALLALCDAELGAQLQAALRFPLKPEAGTPTDEADRILKAYSEIRKRSACRNRKKPEWLGGEPISRDPADPAFLVLPDYPLS